MYMIKGEMRLHYRTPAGDEKVAVVREGEIIYCPAGTPHSPRSRRSRSCSSSSGSGGPTSTIGSRGTAPSAVSELHESVKHVADYREDPVLPRMDEEFYGSEAHRTCGRCGHVTAATVDAALIRDHRLKHLGQEALKFRALRGPRARTDPRGAPPRYAGASPSTGGLGGPSGVLGCTAPLKSACPSNLHPVPSWCHR
jgi:hypothetical protein